MQFIEWYHFNDLQWSLTRIPRSRHFLKSSIWKTARQSCYCARGNYI